MSWEDGPGGWDEGLLTAAEDKTWQREMVKANPDYKAWDEDAKKTKGIGPDYDYGISDKPDENGHYTDKGKLQNHITYSGPGGGKWSKDNKTYTPSKQQIDYFGADYYSKYFDSDAEPNAKVILRKGVTDGF